MAVGRCGLSASATEYWLRNHQPRPNEDVSVECHYHEHTADVEENQLLAWSLHTVLRSGLCHEPALTVVRRARQTLLGTVSLKQFKGTDCTRRPYDRLNDDYRPLHSLCRFFLENTGPSHACGESEMLPFKVNMARLYERFVAEWLAASLPPPWKVRAQEEFSVGERGVVSFNIDIVLYDSTSGAPLCVLDTKYKTPDRPATDDISQVISYAVAKGCKDAVLVYPAAPTTPLDEKIGGIRVRSLTFSLSHDLDLSGETFVKFLLDDASVSAVPR